ncbi:MAG: response regulator [Hyphomonas sp.]|uniref:PAS domain-containing hybrid sensor histidine kinase/response regulator n=1 Tax=Hyphomonas sp. TaxID=87 RepID=UPI003528DAA6
MNSVGKLDLLMGVMNLLPNPVYIKNADHVWIEANSAFCAFLGRTRDELIGKTDHDYFPKDQADVFWDMDTRVLTTRERNVNLEQNSNAAGEVRWVESSKSYFEDGDGNAFIIGVLMDVTELKKREQALQAAEQAALHASRSKSEFLANMSHEIRTPMNGVLGMSQILRRTQLTADQEEIVATIERSGEALLTIINDILDFSKIEAGKFEIDPAPFALASVVEDVAALLASGASDKGVELITDIAPHLPEKLVGDAGRIRQVLTNLVGNAIKFTSEGYVLVMANGEVSDGHAELRLAVEDTGIGIPEEKQDAIFRQFEQADASTTRRFGGTGLGLSICRSLVEAMGGEVGVISAPGKGSTFEVFLRLPIAESTAAAGPVGPCAHDLSHIRALVLDDIDLNCRIARTQLAVHDMPTESETDPARALQRLVEAHNRRDPLQLLVLDYQMPRIDGLKVARMIRSKPAFRDLKIIVQSSVDTPDVKNAFTAAGVSDFLVKPLRSGALAASVAKAFGCDGTQTLRSTPTQRAAAEARPKEGVTRRRILVAEDNEVNQKVMRGLLAGCGFALDFAGDGQVAVELFRAHDYALVLMDVSMPVMDGIAATQAIRDLEAEAGRPATPILAVTAHALRKEQESFRVRGMDGVLVKPVDQDELLEAVAHWTDMAARDVA